MEMSVWSVISIPNEQYIDDDDKEELLSIKTLRRNVGQAP